MNRITLQDLETLVQDKLGDQDVLELRVRYHGLEDDMVYSFVIHVADPDGFMRVYVYSLKTPCLTEVLIESLSEYFKDQMHIIVAPVYVGTMPHIHILNMKQYDYVGLSRSNGYTSNFKCPLDKRRFIISFRQSYGYMPDIKRFKLELLTQHMIAKINNYVGAVIDNLGILVNLIEDYDAEYEIPHEVAYEK